MMMDETARIAVDRKFPAKMTTVPRVERRAMSTPDMLNGSFSPEGKRLLTSPPTVGRQRRRAWSSWTRGAALPRSKRTHKRLGRTDETCPRSSRPGRTGFFQAGPWMGLAPGVQDAERAPPGMTTRIRAGRADWVRVDSSSSCSSFCPLCLDCKGDFKDGGGTLLPSAPINRICSLHIEWQSEFLPLTSNRFT